MLLEASLRQRRLSTSTHANHKAKEVDPGGHLTEPRTATRMKTRSYNWAHCHKDQISPAKKEEQRPAQSQWEWATMRCQTCSWLSHCINPLIAVRVALWGTWCCWDRDQRLGRTQEERRKNMAKHNLLTASQRHCWNMETIKQSEPRVNLTPNLDPIWPALPQDPML